MSVSHERMNKSDIVLEKLGITTPILLGKGDEGRVYEYGSDALKIYTRSPDLEYLHNLQAFQVKYLKGKFTFDTPEIFKIGQEDGFIYTVEKKLSGVQMDKKLIGSSTAERQKMYKSYYEAIRQVHNISLPDLPYGEIIKIPDYITSESWTNFLKKKLDKKIASTIDRISPLVPNFARKVELMKKLISQYLLSNEKRLVHRDYFLNNVLIGDDLQISAILDFSGHIVAGDPRMDIASVLMWNEIDPNVRPEDYKFLYKQAEEDYGPSIKEVSEIFLLYDGFYFADMDDPSFSVKCLNNDVMWDKYI